MPYLFISALLMLSTTIIYNLKLTKLYSYTLSTLFTSTYFLKNSISIITSTWVLHFMFIYLIVVITFLSLVKIILF